MKLNSSNIAEADWANGKLTVTFKQGRSTYEYDNVPESVFTEMTEASSVGSYFYHNIKGKYNYRKLN